MKFRRKNTEGMGCLVTAERVTELALIESPFATHVIRADPGDWVVTGARGHRTVCSNQVFRACYVRDENDRQEGMEKLIVESRAIADELNRSEAGASAVETAKRVLRTEMTKVFKPYIVRRPRGQCQVLFALPELDTVVDDLLKVVFPPSDDEIIKTTFKTGEGVGE